LSIIGAGEKGTHVSWGTLYGIGLGPGDPELLTRKAFRILSTVLVIFYPSCGGKAEGFALDILQRAFADEEKALAGTGAGGTPDPTEAQPVLERCRPLSTSMPRGGGIARPDWEQAAETVAEVLQRGQDAAFITEGDPSLYSTFVYLQTALAARLPGVTVEIVPGVSSVTAAAARAAFPLALADERVAILPATYDPQFLEQALEGFDTVILLKVNRVIDQLLPILEARALLDKAVLVERCGTPRERVVRDVKSLRGQRLDYFSLLLVRR
jgi:precorrin-2/cobalt-factor-2 C20-methyltransferase